MLAACASLDPELTAARESWRGASYDDVVAAWGPPNRIVKSGAQENHIWVSEDRMPPPPRGGPSVGVGVGVGRSSGSSSVGVGVGVGGIIFGGSAGERPVRCERTLVIQDARVVRDADWNGEPEFCKRFARKR